MAGFVSFVAFVVLLIAIAPSSWSLALGAFETKTAAFAVAFKGEVSAYREMSAFVLPAATLTLEAIGGPPGAYGLRTRDGAVTASDRKWR